METSKNIGDPNVIKENTLVIVINPPDFGFGIIESCAPNDFNFIIRGKGEHQIIAKPRPSFIPILQLEKKYRNVGEAIQSNLHAILGKLAILSSDRKHKEYFYDQIKENTLVAIIGSENHNIMAPINLGIVLSKSPEGECHVQIGLIRKIQIKQSLLLPIIQTDGRTKNPNKAVRIYTADILLKFFLQILGQKMSDLQIAISSSLNRT